MATFRRVFQENSFVFITMVTENRKPLLINNIEVLRNSFKHVKRFHRYEIFAVSVMPDHLHMVIKPECIEEYPKIISSIKHHFSRNCKEPTLDISSSKHSKREKGLWQRRYWEHTIRDEKDLNNHIDYIHFNPAKHRLVNNINDWEYSSFHKFFKEGFYEKEWGKLEDIANIKDWDFE